MRAILIVLNIVGAVLIFVLTPDLTLRLAGVCANIANLAILLAASDDDALWSMRSIGKAIALIGIIGAPVSLLVNAIQCGIGNDLSCGSLFGSFFYASILIGLFSIPFWYALDAIFTWYNGPMADLTQKLEILAFMRQSKVGVIGTVNAKGEPELATVTIAVDDDFNVYFLTRRDTRKFPNLEQSKRVGMVIGASPAAPTSVQLQGDAEFVQNFPNDVAKFLAHEIDLTKTEAEPLAKLPGSNFVMIKVKPTWLRWMTSQDGFQQII